MCQAETDGVNLGTQTAYIDPVVAVSISSIVLTDDGIGGSGITLNGFRHPVLAIFVVVTFVGALGKHCVCHGALEPVVPVRSTTAFRLGTEVVILEGCTVRHEDDEQVALSAFSCILGIDCLTQLVDCVEGIVVVGTGPGRQTTECIICQVVNSDESIRIQSLAAGIDLVGAVGTASDGTASRMVFSVDIIGAAGIGVVTVKVRNRNTDVHGQAIVTVGLQLLHQALQRGLQNGQSGLAINGIVHGAGQVKHNDDVRALLHGHTGSGQLHTGHAGFLEIDAGSGLANLDRTLIGVIGIVVASLGHHIQSEVLGDLHAVVSQSQAGNGTGLAGGDSFAILRQHGNVNGDSVVVAVFQLDVNQSAGIGYLGSALLNSAFFGFHTVTGDVDGRNHDLGSAQSHAIVGDGHGILAADRAIVAGIQSPGNALAVIGEGLGSVHVTVVIEDIDASLNRGQCVLGGRAVGNIVGQSAADLDVQTGLGGGGFFLDVLVQADRALVGVTCLEDTVAIAPAELVTVTNDTVASVVVAGNRPAAGLTVGVRGTEGTTFSFQVCAIVQTDIVDTTLITGKCPAIVIGIGIGIVAGNLDVHSVVGAGCSTQSLGIAVGNNQVLHTCVYAIGIQRIDISGASCGRLRNGDPITAGSIHTAAAGTFAGHTVDVEGSRIACVAVDQTASIVVEYISTVAEGKGILTSADGERITGGFQCSGNLIVAGIGQLGVLGSVAQKPAAAAGGQHPFLCGIVTGNGIRAADVGALNVEALTDAAVALLNYLGQHEMRAVVEDQILSAADQIGGRGHAGIGTLGGGTGIGVAATGNLDLFTGRGDLGVQAQGFRGADSRSIGGIVSAVGILHIVHTRGLQIMGAIGIVTADRDISIGDRKGGHGQRFIYSAAIGSAVVTHITGIHVGEGQSLLLKFSGAVLGNIDLVATSQEDSGAAQIIIPTVGVVVAEHKDNVQAGIASLIQHIKDVVCVHTVVTAGAGTHAVMQRQMGHDENGLGIAGIPLGVQVSFQVLCGLLDGSFIIVTPHVVLLVNDKDTVVVRIVGATGGQGAANQAVTVMVALNVDLVHTGAVNCLHSLLQLCLAVGRVFVIDIVVTGKQEAVHSGISRLDLMQQAGNDGGTVIVAACLEVRTCQDIGGLTAPIFRCECADRHYTNQHHQAKKDCENSLHFLHSITSLNCFKLLL